MMQRRPSRDPLAVVREALRKALDQLNLAQSAAELADDTLGREIAAAAQHLRRLRHGARAKADMGTR